MESLKTKKIVTFGEVMMRLSPPANATYSQATSLDFLFGGGEANVAISLAYFGIQAAHVTQFPNTNLGRAATQFLRHHWIDTSHVFYGDGDMGLYFLEKGAVYRPSEIIYQRAHSAFTRIDPKKIDWKKILEGADWFHWTGITPAVSQGSADCCAAAIKAANELGVTVSGDIHSRNTLWKYGKSQKEIMPTLIEGCDIVIASKYDVDNNCDLKVNDKDDNEFREAASRLMNQFPRIKKVIDKDRESVSASHNRIKGKLWNGQSIVESQEYNITHIVDRIGTGDAYAAGLIYGLLNFNNDSEALNFAAAACALKHSVEGDANLGSADRVLNLMNGDTSGRIQR